MVPGGVRLHGAAAAVLLAPFALLTALVAGNWAPLHAIDRSVTLGLHSMAVDHPVLADAMLVWTTVFGPAPLRVAALVLVIWLIRRHHARHLALWVAVTMAAGGVLAALLKLVVGRDRPELLEPLARATGLAFPSGHATNAALAAGVFLLVLLPLSRHRPGRRAALWTAAVVVTVVTGLSRVVLGVHWPSDVVAGWLLGGAVIAATAAAFRSRTPVPEAREAVEQEPASPAGR